MSRLAATLLFALALAGAPGLAQADDHDPCRSGHPLRVAAYLLHPIGVIVDTLLFRPAHWFVHHEPARTLFGHDGCC